MAKISDVIACDDWCCAIQIVAWGGGIVPSPQLNLLSLVPDSSTTLSLQLLPLHHLMIEIEFPSI